MASSDHGDAGLGQHFGVAAQVENERWVVDFFQAVRVERVFHGEQSHARCGGARDLVACEFRRFSRGQRLCRDVLNGRTFQFGQQRAKHLLC